MPTPGSRPATSCACRRCAPRSGPSKKPRPWREEVARHGASSTVGGYAPPRIPDSVRRRLPARHRQAGRRGGAWRQRRELWHHRAIAHGPARGRFSGTGAPAGPRNQRHFADRQAPHGPETAAGPVPRARNRQGLSGAGQRQLAGQPARDRQGAAQIPAAQRRAARQDRAPTTIPTRMRSVTLVKVKAPIAANPLAPARRSRCWKSPSRPAARTRSACTWPAKGHPIAGDDKYGDFELNKALQQAAQARFAQTHVPACLAPEVQPSQDPQGGSAAGGLAGELQQFLPSALPSLPQKLEFLRNCVAVTHVMSASDNPAMHTRNFDLIAFDWDGTLFDSTQIIVRCIQAAVLRCGRRSADRQGGRLCHRHGPDAGAGPCRARRAARKIPGAGRALPAPLRRALQTT